METIINIQFPLKRVPPINDTRGFPWWRRLLWPLLSWGGGSIGEFGGSRTNRVTHITVLRRHMLTIHRNEYHDRTDAERADHYLREWSKAEKELQMFRAKLLGEDMAPEIKQLIRESMGVDFDEGTVL